MTTIAYRNGILATDSRACSGGWMHTYQATKLFRIADGTVCAVSGDLAPVNALVEWIDKGKSGSQPSIGEDTRVVHMVGIDRLIIYEGSGSFEITCKLAAFGSGAPPAEAAMHAGADPVKAIEIASMIDPYTGGPVVTMSIIDETATERASA